MSDPRLEQIAAQLTATLRPFIDHAASCSINVNAANPDGDFCTCGVREAIMKANGLCKELLEALESAQATVRAETPREGCINCGEADQGGYMTGFKGSSDEGAVGPFCSECWELTGDFFKKLAEGRDESAARIKELENDLAIAQEAAALWRDLLANAKVRLTDLEADLERISDENDRICKQNDELAAQGAPTRAEGRSAWQAIETAPKDGRSVVLWWPYWSALRPVIGWWTMNLGWQANEVLEGDSEPPTHWMPLPAPPEGDVTP
jgi:hypothetical protein